MLLVKCLFKGCIGVEHVIGKEHIVTISDIVSLFTNIIGTKSNRVPRLITIGIAVITADGIVGVHAQHPFKERQFPAESTLKHVDLVVVPATLGKFGAQVSYIGVGPGTVGIFVPACGKEVV